MDSNRLEEIIAAAQKSSPCSSMGNTLYVNYGPRDKDKWLALPGDIPTAEFLGAAKETVLELTAAWVDSDKYTDLLMEERDNLRERVDNAIRVVLDHNNASKDWLIHQMLRMLCGCPVDAESGTTTAENEEYRRVKEIMGVVK